MTHDPKARLKGLIEKGRQNHFLLETEIREVLPPDLTEEELVQDILAMIRDMGIEVRSG